MELFRQLLMLPALGPDQLKLLGEIMYQVELSTLMSAQNVSHAAPQQDRSQSGLPWRKASLILFWLLSSKAAGVA